MIPVQTILPAALASIVRKAPLTDEKVTFAWRTAVGPVIAGASEVSLSVEKGTLYVRARDRAWQRELERSAATIRRRLDDLLGAGVVRALEITSAAASTPGPRPAVPPRAKEPEAAARAPKTRPSGGESNTARRRR